MAEEKREEYSSIHDGPSIDNAVARALPGAAIDASIQAKPNPNLLDNWYFGNPVNQRGHTEYTNTGYAIDRWKLNQWNTTSIACSIVTNGLRVYGEASGSCSTSIKQFVEGLKAGLKVTASVLVTDFTAGAAVYLFIRTNSGVRLARVRFSAPGLYSVTTTLPDDFEGNLMIDIGQGGSDGGDGNTDFTVLATKLELGSQHTLAHQDADGNWVPNEIPDYGEQLARCRRYFCRFNFGRNDLFFGSLSTNLDKAWITIPTPVVMRTAPSVSFYGNFNGVIRGNGFQLEFLTSNSTVAADTSTTRCCNILITPNTKPSAWTAQQVVMIYTSSEWYVDCSADL